MDIVYYNCVNADQIVNEHLVNRHPALIIGHKDNINMFYISSCNQEDDQIDAAIIARIKASGIPYCALPYEGGAILRHPDDFSFIYVGISDTDHARLGKFMDAIIDVLNTNFNCGVYKDNNDLMLNGRKVGGSCYQYYGDDSYILAISISLHDNDELMRQIYREKYGVEGYKVPGHISNVSRNALEPLIIDKFEREFEN